VLWSDSTNKNDFSDRLKTAVWQILRDATTSYPNHNRLCYKSEATYPSTKTRKKTLVVECTQAMQLFHRRDKRLHRRSIHKVEWQQVVDAHRFQREDSARKIRALDLRHVGRHHLVAVRSLGVQSVTFARTGPTRTARPLFCLRLIDYTTITWQ